MGTYVIYETESTLGYSIVVVEDREKRERVLEFHDGRGSVIKMGRYDLNTPEIPGNEYARAMLAFALWQPVPNKIMNIGLGTGRLALVLEALFPGVHIVNVDTEPLIPFVAQNFFDFNPGQSNTVVVGDGRDILEHMDARQCDVILVDAFGIGLGPPAHMWDTDFFRLCKRKLKPGGVVVLNVMDSSQFVGEVYGNMREVFREMRGIYANKNHVFFGVERSLAPARLVRRAEALDRKSGNIHDFRGLARKLVGTDELDRTIG